MRAMNSNAMIQFNQWFREAVDADMVEPNAMSLATVSSNGQPTLRTVLYKGLTKENGISFYTNYDSRKAKDILANPFGALLFCWLPMVRQIRVEGRIKKLSPEQSESYFHSRPRGSQIGAWVSNQSSEIESRDVLATRKEEIELRFKDVDKIPLPPFWGGYQLVPHRIEFWQGNDDRLHDRFSYELVEEIWEMVRLAP
ncbi:UNVERIFIED_CONTAM: hypothetical protein GTU68_016141 [Idotea baltica]|nr:hypothetical protein [Idotea baltica]